MERELEVVDWIGLGEGRSMEGKGGKWEVREGHDDLFKIALMIPRIPGAFDLIWAGNQTRIPDTNCWIQCIVSLFGYMMYRVGNDVAMDVYVYKMEMKRNMNEIILIEDSFLEVEEVRVSE
jgi:hypothetical protein